MKIQRFNEFYTGPNAAVGFKRSEPKNIFSLDVIIKYDSWNEEIIQGILKKHNISYDDLSLKKEGEEGQRFKLNFLSYNEYEADSIITIILNELGEKEIGIDPRSVEVSPEIRKYITPDESSQRNIISGFKKNV
jgi:hypothetical protein